MLQSRTVQLSAAQILALDTTPVQAIPAPGASRFIQIISVNAQYIFGTAAYTGGSDIGLWVGDPVNGEAGPGIDHEVLQQTENQIQYTPLHTTDDFWDAQSLLENQAINVQAGATPFASGDGELRITIYYATVVLI